MIIISFMSAADRAALLNELGKYFNLRRDLSVLSGDICLSSKSLSDSSGWCEK